MTGRDVTMAQWAHDARADLTVISASSPEPVLLEHNLIGRFENADEAREVLLAWERIRVADAAVGMVAMGHHDGARPTSVDPAHVASHAASRSLRGAVPGAVVGGIVVAAFVLIWQGGDANVAALLGGLLGGAAFGAVAGAMLSFVMGTGWGAAYRESFVDDDETVVVFASIHSDSADDINAAVDAASMVDAEHLERVDRRGRTIR